MKTVWIVGASGQKTLEGLEEPVDWKTALAAYFEERGELIHG